MVGRVIAILWPSSLFAIFICDCGCAVLYFSVDYLKECFHLDEIDFKLYWKERPVNHFKSKRAHSRFNTMFSGKLAGMVYETQGLRYVRIKFHSKAVFAHRVIWAIYYGEVPKFSIDHKDGDGLNNIPDNLRLCSDDVEFTNSRNRRKARNNTSGRTGVYWRSERSIWIARGRIYNKDGTFKSVQLGSFINFDDAVSAREKWEVENSFTYREI